MYELSRCTIVRCDGWEDEVNWMFEFIMMIRIYLIHGVRNCVLCYIRHIYCQADEALRLESYHVPFWSCINVYFCQLNVPFYFSNNLLY